MILRNVRATYMINNNVHTKTNQISGQNVYTLLLDFQV